MLLLRRLSLSAILALSGLGATVAPTLASSCTNIGFTGPSVFVDEGVSTMWTQVWGTCTPGPGATLRLTVYRSGILVAQKDAECLNSSCSSTFVVVSQRPCYSLSSREYKAYWSWNPGPRHPDKFPWTSPVLFSTRTINCTVAAI